MSTKIFVSSTCYDLIDIRSEIEPILSENGFTPILSDSNTSEFTIHPDINSIESCLVNVKDAGIFVIILSQRYGSSLKESGFEDISATHLEYNTAVNSNIPIYMYVRDKLEAELSIYKKNVGNPKIESMLSWIKPKDLKIFDLLEEHKKLSAQNTRSNWIGTFKNSRELKMLLIRDLQFEVGKAILNKLILKGEMPFLIVHMGKPSPSKENKLKLHISIKNSSNILLLNPELKLVDDLGFTINGTEMKMNTFDIKYIGSVDFYFDADSLKDSLGLHVQYTLPQGVTLFDSYLLNMIDNIIILKGKTFVSNNNIKIDTVSNN